MEPTLVMIAWQCIRDIALAVVAIRRNRSANRTEVREKAGEGGRATKVSVARALSAPPRPPRRVTGSAAHLRRRGTCGG
jgi:hypothetical protein